MSLPPEAMKSESADHERLSTSSPWPPNVWCSAKGVKLRSSAGVAHTCTSRPMAKATHRPSGENFRSATLPFRLRWCRDNTSEDVGHEQVALVIYRQ